MAGSESDISGQIQAALRAELAPVVEELRHFVDRRIAELSAEIHCATQLMDYSEANLSGQLSHIREEIGRIVAAPAAATRNSGLELEVVVEATEAAANQILEAAEAIGTWVQQGVWDASSAEAVTQRLNAIFEACTFQDLTGQRIRRAIEHLQSVEAMLGGLTHADASPQEALKPAADLAQDDVDRLFG